MRLFAAYLKQRVKVLVAFALFCVIFAIIFGLYRLPLEAVIYPAVLCAILGAVFVALTLLPFGAGINSSAPSRS